MSDKLQADLRVSVPGDLADWIDEYAARHAFKDRKRVVIQALALLRRREQDRMRKQQKKAGARS